MTYLYRRQSGTFFEITQSMKDEALTVCPTTGEPCERVPYPGRKTRLEFKGKDWTVPSKGYSAIPMPK